MEVDLAKLSLAELIARITQPLEAAQEHCADICAEYVEPLSIELARKDAIAALEQLNLVWSIVEELKRREAI